MYLCLHAHHSKQPVCETAVYFIKTDSFTKYCDCDLYFLYTFFLAKHLQIKHHIFFSKPNCACEEINSGLTTLSDEFSLNKINEHGA